MNELSTLFESLDLSGIRQLITKHRTEDLHIEFKTISEAFREKSDKRSLAKCISGFANSDGGVVIWGIEARPDEDGVDCAEREELIPNVALALGRLQSLTGEAASPVPDGVLHRAVPAEGHAGFLVSLIPRSDSGPHMAEFGEHQYYKRSGDSFYRMEHFDLEDMFGRRKRPVLALVTRIEQAGTESGSGGTIHNIRVVVGIENNGRGVARFPLLELRVEAPLRVSGLGLDGNGHTGLPRLVRSGARASHPVFAGGIDDVIHVDSLRDVTALADIRVDDSNRRASDIRIGYVIRADDARAVEGTHVIQASEILAALDAPTS